MSETEIKELKKSVDALTSAARELMTKIDQVMDIILDDIDLEEDMEMSERIHKRRGWEFALS